MRASPTFLRLAAIVTHGILNHSYIVPPTTRFLTTTSKYLNKQYSLFPQQYLLKPSISGTTRLYSSSNNNSNKGFFSKLVGKAKSILPLQSTDEKKKKAQIQKQEISSGISLLLKDAPLGVRLMGKLITPMLSNMAEIFREQGELMENVLNIAELLIRNDASAKSILGDSIEVGAPFSRSSSSSSINGKSSTQIMVSFPVQGSYGSGIASVVAMGSDGMNTPVITSLKLDVGGRVLNLNTDLYSIVSENGSSNSSSRLGKNSNIGKIIDAEFVEKK